MKKLIVALLTGAMVLSLAACGGGSGAAGGAAPALRRLPGQAGSVRRNLHWRVLRVRAEISLPEGAGGDCLCLLERGGARRSMDRQAGGTGAVYAGHGQR